MTEPRAYLGGVLEIQDKLRETPPPTTRAGRWLVDRSEWDSGNRAFRVRINATAGPDDMHRHVLTIEREAAAAERARLVPVITEYFAAVDMERGAHEARMAAPDWGSIWDRRKRAEQDLRALLAEPQPDE